MAADAGRRAACLARFGGEEFVAVLPGVSLDDAVAAAERFRAQVAALDVSRWAPDRGVTISVGVTALAAGDTLSSLLRRADEALYAAKAAGRNSVVARPAPLRAAAAVAPSARPACRWPHSMLHSAEAPESFTTLAHLVISLC